MMKSPKKKTTTLWDFLKGINETKIPHFDEESSSDYSPYIINRALSNFSDTVLMANEMNLNPQIPKRFQELFLINIIRKRKRFSKWNKATKISDIEEVKAYYGYSNKKAKYAMKLLSPEQITKIKEKVHAGGRTY